MNKPFLDTNVLIYAFGAGEKAERARCLLDEGGIISVQCLNEFVNVSRRKLGMSWREVHASLESLAVLLGDVRSLDPDTHDQAVLLAERYNVTIYDALILAAALTPNCDVVYSEDLQHGQVFEKRLRVVNPFKDG